MRRVATMLAAVLVLGGCGGSTATPPVAKPPHIPRALAREWAVQANAVADALAARDGCTAVAHANTLRADVDQLQSRIPARLRATLLATVDALPGRITCNPPAPQPHPHDKHPDHPKPPHDHGHGHEH